MYKRNKETTTQAKRKNAGKPTVKATERKPFQELELRDAFMFAAVMEDEELCRKMLERILEFPIEKVVVRTEEVLFVNSDYHGIRMDVYARDEQGTIFNVEMQMASQDAELIARRSRYYQSQLDMTLLKPGESYRKLPDSYVIFICASFDPFGEGLYRYTFLEQCQENSSLLLDGTAKIFLSCKGTNDAEVPGELVDFLRYVEQSASLRDGSDDLLAQDELLVGVESRIKAIKKNRGMGERYMLFEEMLAEERFEGHEEGFSEGHAAGLSEGLAEGQAQGRAESQKQMLALIAAMTEDGKLADVPRLGEAEFFQAMLVRYGLV